MTDFLIDAETLQQFMTALTALILVIIAWYNKQRTDIAKAAVVTAAAVPAPVTTPAPVVTPATAAVQPGSAAAAAPASTVPGVSTGSLAACFDLGFSVTPTLLYGLKSPAIITFRMTASQNVDHPGIESVDIAWDDGSSQNVKFVNGYAEVVHIFTFTPIPHYTGWTFNPVFILNGTDGSKRTFNVDGTSVEIGIEA